MGHYWLVGGCERRACGGFEQTAATASKLIMCQCLCRLLSLHKRQVEGAAGGWVVSLLICPPCFCRVSALPRWPCNAVLQISLSGSFTQQPLWADTLQPTHAFSNRECHWRSHGVFVCQRVHVLVRCMLPGCVCECVHWSVCMPELAVCVYLDR